MSSRRWIPQRVLISILFVVFVSGVCWRVDQYFVSGRTAWLESDLKSQLEGLKQSLGLQIFFFKSLMNESGPLVVRTWPSFLWAAGVFSGNESALELNPNVQTLTKDQVKSVFEVLRVKSKDTEAQNIFFSSLGQKSKSGRVIPHHIGMASRMGSKLLVVLFDAEVFQSLIDRTKARFGEVWMLSEEHQILAHSQSEYIGSKIQLSAGLGEYLKSLTGVSGKSSQGLNKYRDENGEVSFRLGTGIDSTNIVLLAKSPQRSVTAERGFLLLQIGVLGLGCFLILVAVFLLGPQDSVQSLEAPKQKKAQIPVQEEAPKLPRDSKEIFQHLAQVLGPEVRAPLNSAMAHIQAALARGSLEGSLGDDLQKSLSHIRDVKGFVQKIANLGGSEPVTKNEMKLETAVRRVLKKMEPDLNRSHVKVSCDFSSDTTLAVDLNLISRSLENLIRNSIEAMERQAEKSLSLGVVQSEGEVGLYVRDTGPGMEPETLAKATDPFFSTRTSRHHQGLGLTETQALAKEHGGRLQLQTLPNQGLEAVIWIPKTDLKKSPRLELDLPKVPQVLESKPDLKVTTSSADEAPKKSSSKIQKLRFLSEGPSPSSDNDIEKLLAFDEEPEAAIKAQALTKAPSELEDALTEIKEKISALEGRSSEGIAPLKASPLVLGVPQGSFQKDLKTPELDGFKVQIRRPLSVNPKPPVGT